MMKSRTPREGNVIVLVAACLTVLMSVVAIAIDGGVLMDDRQKVQAAADASALAAAEQLYLNWQADLGLDPHGTAVAAAIALAKSNGYPNDGTISVITPNLTAPNSSGTTEAVHGVWAPPATGKSAHVGKAGYVEVALEYNQK